MSRVGNELLSRRNEPRDANIAPELDSVLRPLVGLKEFSTITPEVGYFGPEGKVRYTTGSKHTVAKVAMIMEYGSLSPRVPRRPFLSWALVEQQDKIRAFVVEQAKAVMKARIDPRDAMIEVAKFMHRLVLRQLDNLGGASLPLAPSTVKAKGHSKELFDTGLLKRQLVWRVRQSKKNGGFKARGTTS